MASAKWTITRSGDQVRIDITHSSRFSEADTRAIEQTLEEYLSDDGVTVVRVSGSVLNRHPLPDALGSAIEHLGNLARVRGKGFQLRPI